MDWHEFSIITSNQAEDAVTNMLENLGTEGVSIENPEDMRVELQKETSLDYFDEEFIHSLGTNVTIKTYFSAELEHLVLLKQMSLGLEKISEFLDVGPAEISYRKVADEDWSTSWKKYYKVFSLTDTIKIKPSWEKYKKVKDEIIIELDPGMAFGTGTHETTKMCSGLLEKYLHKNDTVIDVGTGSGILAIIAAKLSAKEVIACDLDELAVKVAKENIALNEVNDKINIFQGVIEDIQDKKADIIVANIIANVIIDIKDEVKKLLNQGGYFITSGIIKERKQEVFDAYLSLGFSLIEEEELGEWVGMIFKCPDFL